MEAKGPFDNPSCHTAQDSCLEQTLLTPHPRQIPLSWRDAQLLLQALRGHGYKLDDHWTGAVPGVDEWWTGDATSPTVLLQNDQEEVERNPIYNVLGKITGVEQPEKSSTYLRRLCFLFRINFSAESCLGSIYFLDISQCLTYPVKQAMLTPDP